MADTPYLVALALVEIDGRRALPLGGQSWPAAATATDPGDMGRGLTLDLLLRLWQRSEEGGLHRAAGDTSLLLLEMPLERMSEQLPRHKATWIAGGATDTLLDALKGLADRAWQVSIAKYEPVRFTPWPAAGS